MSSSTTDVTDEDLRARIAHLESLLSKAAVLHGADKGTRAGLLDALAYSESIVDTVREPLLVLDSTLHVRTASQSFYRTFGVVPEETIGEFVYDLGNGQWNIPALRRLLEEVLPQEKAFRNFEVSHTFSDIGHRVMLLNGRKLVQDDGEQEGVLLAIEDVTARKRLEDELIRSNEDLQRFAYVAAHDLRSPLNSGLRLLQLLSRSTKASLNQDDASTLALAIETLQRLGALMHDILSYSEVSNAPQRRVEVDLKESLDIALQNLQHHIEECSATIDVSDLPSVTADRTQIVMVFQNLISNALKYRRQVSPHIFIGAVREDDQWRISVRDNGQGFSPEYASGIFEPFKRLHGPNVAGSGIGLATCKRVVERLGGHIWADSTPGQGSTFNFTSFDCEPMLEVRLVMYYYRRSSSMLAVRSSLPKGRS
jgi:two-component system CheB/CheR fusion protein